MKPVGDVAHGASKDHVAIDGKAKHHWNGAGRSPAWRDASAPSPKRLEDASS